MSIIGGALIPAVMGRISDASNIRIALVVPAHLLCVRDLFRDEWIQPNATLPIPQPSGASRGPMTKRYCLTLDLQDELKLIAEYKRYHETIWPEITKSIKDSGIENLEIYQLGTRLFMVMEVSEQFSFAARPRRTKKTRRFKNGRN